MSEPVHRSGRVVTKGGAPVPNALIVIVAGSVPMPEIALLSNDEGRFSLSLPPGLFTVRAHGPTGAGDVGVDSGSAHDEIVIVIGQ